MAVLVAIAIPIFTTQLEKSRQSTDAANIRSCYAEASTAVLSGDGATSYYASTPLQSADGNFGKIDATTEVGGVALSSLTGFTKGQTAYVVVDKDGKVTITTTAPTGATDVSSLS